MNQPSVRGFKIHMRTDGEAANECFKRINNITGGGTRSCLSRDRVGVSKPLQFSLLFVLMFRDCLYTMFLCAGVYMYICLCIWVYTVVCSFYVYDFMLMYVCICLYMCASWCIFFVFLYVFFSVFRNNCIRT